MSNPYGNLVRSVMSGRLIGPHVFAWENFMGNPVPDGCCIHHGDGDKLNNDILNLFCMEKGEHSKWHHRSKIVSAETRKNISDARKGRPCSAETKKKISDAQKGQKRGSYEGRPCSAETKKKISDAQKGQKRRPLSVEHRKKISDAKKDK